MSRTKDELYSEKFRWLAEKLTRENQYPVLGVLLWLGWREKIHLPQLDLKALKRWSHCVFFLIGFAYMQPRLLSSWWSDLQIRWLVTMMF